MSVREIQEAITELPPEELSVLLEWIEQYDVEPWDRQIAEDAAAGRFDALRDRVRSQRESGECRPL